MCETSLISSIPMMQILIATAMFCSFLAAKISGFAAFLYLLILLQHSKEDNTPGI
jgi:hypothetical protein